MKRPKNKLSASLSKGLMKLVKKERVAHFQVRLKPRFKLKDRHKYLRLFDQLQWVNIGNGSWQ